MIFFVAHFGFEDGTLILIASVPDHCFPYTLILISKSIDSKSNTILMGA